MGAVRFYAILFPRPLHDNGKSLTFAVDTFKQIYLIIIYTPMTTRDIKDRYINPYTDFGFKKLFGTEVNKELLISFINSLLHGREKIKNLTYLNTEQLGTSEADRRAVFDVYCENEKGEKFLVEMQRGEQQFFKDRSLYYATFPIREQAQRGDWDYELQRVYVIGILNFRIDGTRPDQYSHEVQLTDNATGEVFYDKLTFIYLEMPKFNKPVDGLESMFEKWLFVLKNLSRLLERPAALQERVFTKLFNAAEIAKFTKEDYEAYEESLKALRDWQNILDTAEKKAREEGRKERTLEMALQMKSAGVPLDVIARCSGLSEEEITKLDDNDEDEEQPEE